MLTFFLDTIINVANEVQTNLQELKETEGILLDQFHAHNYDKWQCMPALQIQKRVFHLLNYGRKRLKDR